MQVEIHITKNVDVTDTNTNGKYTYIVALRLGGLMEDPEIHYENYQFIRADSEKEAVEKYNSLNKCSYFYGEIIEKYQKIK